jgi:excisionase family DNA binding protein
MEKLYAVREVAVILKVHEVTLRRWIAEKKISVIKMNKQIRIEQSEIDKLLQKTL